MKASPGFLLGVVAASLVCPQVYADPTTRTADMPDSWLVLFNTNSPDSVTWANWYQGERNIPAANMVGVAAALTEHITRQEAQDQIISPVRDLLAADPALEEKIMGILVGYDVPGTFGVSPIVAGIGGFSMTDALQDIYDDTEDWITQREFNSVDNPQFSGGMILPPNGRLTKATMQPGRFMTARIDGPDLNSAMDMTIRAKNFESPAYSLYGEDVYYDYSDTTLPTNVWQWLQFAVTEDALTDIPWVEFESDSQPTSNDAFRFGTHDIDGWNDGRLASPDPGCRVLAFNYNSFGATTVRSTSAEGGRYVPNALAEGFAAAIGATGEPQCCIGPVPETLIAGLREGWTIGESYHISTVYDDWMWTLFADPFLSLPNWFDPVPTGPGDGDVNGDGTVDGLDIQVLFQVLTGAETDPTRIAAADLDGNSIIDDDDAFLILGPMVHNSYEPEVLMGSGDANGDNRINGDDISPLVDMLLNGTDGYPLRSRWGADMDKDGAVTMADIALFMDVLFQQVH